MRAVSGQAELVKEKCSICWGKTIVIQAIYLKRCKYLLLLYILLYLERERERERERARKKVRIIQKTKKNQTIIQKDDFPTLKSSSN